jgi:hypothetical protein
LNKTAGAVGIFSVQLQLIANDKRIEKSVQESLLFFFVKKIKMNIPTTYAVIDVFMSIRERERERERERGVATGHWTPAQISAILVHKQCSIPIVSQCRSDRLAPYPCPAARSQFFWQGPNAEQEEHDERLLIDPLCLLTKHFRAFFFFVHMDCDD